MAPALITLVVLSIFLYELRQWATHKSEKRQKLRRAITVIFGVATVFSTIVTILSYCGVELHDIQRILDRGKAFETETDPDIMSDFGDVGTSLYFGAFSVEEGAMSEDAPAIEWIIIHKENDRATLISKYGLIYKPYEEGPDATIWLDSSIRAWLNGEFYQTAFSESDVIIKTTLYTNSQSFPIERRRSEDYVYLLSSEEFESLLSDDNRICAPTVDALRSFRGRSLTVDGDYWYLRDEGKSYNYVATVNQHGSLTSGGSVNNGGGILIRPCITISISSFLAATSKSVHG